MARPGIRKQGLLLAVTLLLESMGAGHGPVLEASTRGSSLSDVPLLAPASDRHATSPLIAAGRRHAPHKKAAARKAPVKGHARHKKTTAQKAPPSRRAPAEVRVLIPPEYDLELDPADRVVEAMERKPRELEAARVASNELLFAYGYALKGAGRSKDALQPLLTYHEGHGRLATYAALLLGETLLELKQYDEAGRWFTEANSGFPAGERQLQARYGLARVALLKGDAAQAAHDLDHLLDEYPRSWRRFEIKLKLARAYEASGQLEQALATYEWLWAWAPAAPEADVSGRELTRFQQGHLAGYTGPNVAVRYRRALKLLGAGQVEAGLSLMLSLGQDAAVSAALPRSYTFELGKAYFQAKQYTEAAVRIDGWYSGTKGNERAEALFWRALTQGRLARFDESIALYRQLAREYPKSSHTETGMFKIGLLRLDQGDYPAAEEAFAQFRERFSRSSQADDAQWYVAWSQLRQGRYAAAHASYEELVRKYPRSELVPGVRYWQGRMAEMQHDKAQAIASFRQTLKSPIASHYAPLAEARLAALGVGREPEPPDQAPEGAPAVELPHPELLERTSTLLSLGLRSWAQEELSAYERGLRGRDEMLGLADWYRRTGNFGGARLIVANLGLGEGVPRLKDPGYTWQLSYPMAFQEQLRGLTLPKKVPWELVYAIMRQESEFKPWTTSRAGARGLMQVMPETANEVCQLRKQPLPGVNTLYRPEVCVQYGSWHLEDLMNRLGGRLPLVIAAYNASPEAVERWMKQKPVDPIDVFIEEISYSETRRYVKRVLTNLWVYRRLHGDGRTPLMTEPGFDKPIVGARLQMRGGQDASDFDPNAVPGDAPEDP